MAVIDRQIATAIQKISRAKSLSDVAYERYLEACARYDWAEVEAARVEMMGHFEASLDHLAALYKLIQVTDGRR